MELLYFFITYFLFLLASSVLITAFFCITRGYTETQPDGTIRRYGKILKGYYFFWFKEKGIKQTKYVDDELAVLVWRMKEYYTESIVLLGNALETNAVISFKTQESFVALIPLLRQKLEVKFKVEEHLNHKVVVSAFTEEPVYIFPDWLRTIMAGCITCTPTVYGNIIYWGAILFFKKSTLYTSLFFCFNNVYSGIILVWLVYWISLAWLNTVLWNIYNKD